VSWLRPRAALAATLAAALVPFVLAGCAGGRGDPPPAVRTVGVRWEQFPDIPFPSGWRPLPGSEPLAIAIGGGAARRLDVSWQAPPARTELEPADAIARYAAAELPATGWTRVGDGQPRDLQQTWRRGDETLQVTAEREDGLAVLRWRLAAPATPVPAR
jgi:hypothetical protein